MLNIRKELELLSQDCENFAQKLINEPFDQKEMQELLRSCATAQERANRFLTYLMRQVKTAKSNELVQIKELEEECKALREQLTEVQGKLDRL